MDALNELGAALVPLLIQAAQVIVPAAAMAAAAWLRARALRQAAEDGAVHAALEVSGEDDQERIAAEHMRRQTVWGRTTTESARRGMVRKHGPEAVRRSTHPPPES